MAIPKRPLKLRKEPDFTVGQWLELCEAREDAKAKREMAQTKAWLIMMQETTEWTRDELLNVRIGEIAAINTMVEEASKAAEEEAVPPTTASG